MMISRPEKPQGISGAEGARVRASDRELREDSRNIVSFSDQYAPAPARAMGS
jgi:hypothetical protein